MRARRGHDAVRHTSLRVASKRETMTPRATDGLLAPCEDSRWPPAHAFQTHVCIGRQKGKIRLQKVERDEMQPVPVGMFPRATFKANE